MTEHKWYGDLGAEPLTGNEVLAQINQTKLPASLFVLQTMPSVRVRDGAIAATVNHYVQQWPHRVQITGLAIVSDTTTSGSDGSNNYAFQIANLTDVVDLFATAPTTEGSELTADTEREFTPDQNLTIEAGDVLQLQITKTGAPVSLSAADVLICVHWKPVGDS